MSDEQAYAEIAKMDLRGLMEVVEQNPHYLADPYYRGYDKAILARWEELCIDDEDGEEVVKALQARIKVLEKELDDLKTASANITYYIPKKTCSMSSLEHDGWQACVDEIENAQYEANKAAQDAIDYTQAMPKEPCGLDGPIGPNHCGWCSTCTAPWEHPNAVIRALAMRQTKQSEGDFWSRLGDDMGVAPEAKPTPQVEVPSEKDACVVCEGWGSVSTGITEAPTTTCNKCEGTGKKVVK